MIDNKFNSLVIFILNNSLQDEQWKEIEWSNGDYFISNKGRVISLCHKEPKLLKQYLCGDGKWGGYNSITMYGKNQKIHRLVANAFLDNPKAKRFVHHIDFDKRNNCLSNLMWVDIKEHIKLHSKGKMNSDE